MFQQMCWLSLEETDEKKVLHLRLHNYQSWKPYWECQKYAVPDYDIPKFPKGLATYHLLKQSGWTLVFRAQSSIDPWEEVQ